MKTVFSNYMVAHVWAQQTQSEGRGSNFYFRDATIYSYGPHFPVASFVKGRVLFNSGSYSVSTSKHIGYARNALSHEQWRGAIRLPCYILKEALRLDSYTNGTYALTPAQMKGHYKCVVKTVAEWIAKEINAAARIAAKRRKKSLVESDIAVALSAADNARALLALYKLKLPAATEKALLELQNDLSAVLLRHEKEIAAEKRKAAKQAAERERLYKERQARLAALIPAAIAKWRKCERLESEEREAMAQVEVIYLRVNGDKVETSRGAEFPVEHAKKAFTLIRHAKEKGQGFTATSALPAPRLGHFQIDCITPQGNVKAGCHFVEWPQIEQVARELAIFP